MKNILVINGPNINMLGRRDKNQYGCESYDDLVKMINDKADKEGLNIDIFTSNNEGDIVTEIQRALNHYDGIIINAAAYTHTSIAIMDALDLHDIPIIEVHISDISKREDFRQISYIEKVATDKVIGKGTKGYILAIDKLIKGN